MTGLRIRPREGTKAYDLLAAAPLIAWYGLCGIPIVAGLAEVHLAAIDILLLSTLLAKTASIFFIGVLLFLLILRRPAVAKAEGLIPRIAAVAGTFLGIAIVRLPPQELTWWGNLLSTLLILAGTGFSLYAVTRLGRSISIMAEARHLVVDGPYAVVRHPLYLGEGLALIGLTLQFMSPVAIAILALQWAFQVERMRNEERVLIETFPEYREYMSRTWRILPGVY